MVELLAKSAGWKSLDIPGGLEYVWFQGRSAHGEILRSDASGPYRLTYDLEWADTWIVSRAQVTITRGGKLNRFSIKNDGTWGGFDLWPTPLTNTFAIRQLGLEVGESGELDVKWINGEKLEAMTSHQRYTRLSQDTYRYESKDFKADLTVDEDSLVRTYAGLFERVF